MPENNSPNTQTTIESIQAAIVESTEHRQALGAFSTGLLALLIYYNVANDANSTLVASWVSIVLLASMFKLVLSQCHRLKKCRTTSIGTRQKFILVSAASTGILWSVPIVFVNFNSPMELFTVILIVSGIISGSVNAYLGQKTCMLWIATSPCLLIIVYLSLKITPIPAPAITSVFVFYIFILFTSVHTRKSVYEMLFVKHEKTKLVEKLQENQKILSELVGKDDLTGLPNRRLLVEIFDMLVKDCQRNGSKFAIAFIDMNDFKMVNDRYGHDVGDKVLISADIIMKEALRESDVVARLGGDEFLAIVKNINDKNDAATAAAKISLSLSRTLLVDGHSINISASVGISVYPDNANSLDALMNIADNSMYRDKRFCQMESVS